MIMSAAKFKSECLALMDKVSKTREEIIITKRGKSVAKLVPLQSNPPLTLFGCLKGTAVILGDVVRPIDTEWDVGA